MLVEVEFLLGNIFKHEHPYMTFDCIVCWKVDMEINDRRILIDGIELKLIFENGRWLLRFCVEKIIPIIELSSIISTLISNDISDMVND